jgi:hypothetical protein
MDILAEQPGGTAGDGAGETHCDVESEENDDDGKGGTLSARDLISTLAPLNVYAPEQESLRRRTFACPACGDPADGEYQCGFCFCHLHICCGPPFTEPSSEDQRQLLMCPKCSKSPFNGKSRSFSNNYPANVPIHRNDAREHAALSILERITPLNAAGNSTLATQRDGDTPPPSTTKDATKKKKKKPCRKRSVLMTCIRWLMLQ